MADLGSGSYKGQKDGPYAGQFGRGQLGEALPTASIVKHSTAEQYGYNPGGEPGGVMESTLVGDAIILEMYADVTAGELIVTLDFGPIFGNVNGLIILHDNTDFVALQWVSGVTYKADDSSAIFSKIVAGVGGTIPLRAMYYYQPPQTYRNITSEDGDQLITEVTALDIITEDGYAPNN